MCLSACERKERDVFVYVCARVCLRACVRVCVFEREGRLHRIFYLAGKELILLVEKEKEREKSACKCACVFL